MIDWHSLAHSCGGTGWLDCECGGDFCVCTLNGGIDCPGCEDCTGLFERYDEANDMPECPRCGEELAPSGICYDCADPLREPDCGQCGGPARDGFCNHCQA